MSNIPSVNTCNQPVITAGIVSPADNDTVNFGSNYTVVCDVGYTVSAESNMECLANGSLNVIHTCASKLIVVGNHAYHYSVSSET